MHPDLLIVAALATPTAVLGPVCLLGHARSRRREDAMAAACAAFRAEQSASQQAAPKLPDGHGESARPLGADQLVSTAES